MNYLLILPFIMALATTGMIYSLRSTAINRLAPTLTSITIFLTGILLITYSAPYRVFLGGSLRVDPISAWMLVTVGAVGFTTTGAGLNSKVSRQYGALLTIFIFAMSLAVEADNIGVMWFAIEATTVATAFLVSQSGTSKSAEAAWKYVVIASSGIAIALLGVVLIFGSSGGTTLSWIGLVGDPQLNKGLLKLGIALTVLGFATKVGLFPMHSWLPDAHSQSPAAVSALMSGVLLSVALYAIIRMRLLSELSTANGEIKGILITMGLISVALASLMMVRQRDIKRLLAYSSMEHMGVMALGVAIGRAAIPAVLIYILAHGLLKASLFVVVGRVVESSGSSDIDQIAKSGGITGTNKYLIVVGLIGLLGLPPFGIFFAEISIAGSAFFNGLGLFISAAFIFTLVAFTSILRAVANLTLNYQRVGNHLSPPLSRDKIVEVERVNAPETYDERPDIKKVATMSSTNNRNSNGLLSNLIIVTSLIGASIFPLFSYGALKTVEIAVNTLTGGAS